MIAAEFGGPASDADPHLKRAVRSFAREEFVNHPYVFAYHTPTTDPDPEPPDRPHVHLVVKIEGRDGRRLNPRKADLRRWREGFARQLRAHGIEANASSRLERLQPRPGLRRPRLETANGHGAGSNLTASRRPFARSQNAEQLEKARLEYYAAVCRVLATSELISDRRLAQQVARFLQAAKAPTREAERSALAAMRDPKPGGPEGEGALAMAWPWRPARRQCKADRGAIGLADIASPEGGEGDANSTSTTVGEPPQAPSPRLTQPLSSCAIKTGNS